MGHPRPEGLEAMPCETVWEMQAAWLGALGPPGVRESRMQL